MKKRILITAALPYANGPLHFGHIAGAYLPADCYARFERMQGNDVLYICGSDEFGIAITLGAQIAKRTPKEHVDIYHEVIKNFFSQLNFSFDHYSRTTWSKHVETTQAFFRDLLENGYIEAKETPQLFSEKEQLFLADRYVIGTCPKCGFDKARGDECPKCAASFEAIDLISPRSKLSNAPLIKKVTKHWFLRFDLFRDKLEKWLASKDWKPNVIHFAKKYIEDLRPRAITRDSDWGIPVPLPEAEGKVFYVWFDAPIGYISATREWAEKIGKPDEWKAYWCNHETKLVQFIGKDNIPFHAVFFPAMIMGQNEPYKLVDELPANEFYNLEGRQFSKSDGWYIDLERFFEAFTTDQIRYAIAANAPESQDSEFSWEDFQMRCNSELAGKYGNLANRVLVFAKQHCDGKIPGMKDLHEVDETFLQKITSLASEISSAYQSFHLRKASQLMMGLAQVGNVYFDVKKPWAARKQEETLQDMYNTIACCIYALKVLAVVSYPIIPTSAEKLWKLLGYTTNLSSALWKKEISEENRVGQPLPTPEILFARVEDEIIAKEITLLHSKKETASMSEITTLKSEINIEDVKKIDLRIGEILEAEKVPKSKKLLKLLVDLGFEKRTIVSGISEAVEDPAHLIGKKVVVVANLQTAKLMGIESQGMVLVVESERKLLFPDINQAANGSVFS